MRSKITTVMTRVVLLLVAMSLCFSAGASAQSQSSKQGSSTSDLPDAPQPSSQLPSAPKPSNRSSADQPNTNQAKPKPAAAPPVNNDPDSLLNSPMTPPGPVKSSKQKNKTKEEFPFPGDEDNGQTYSSSKSNGDFAPPPGLGNNASGPIVAPSNGVTEMKPWDPHQSDKDVEVGTFYYKLGNYKAAESRYRSALHWQNNNAEAHYRLGEVLEKEGKLSEARQYYQAYLKILPSGPFAKDSKKAIARIDSGKDEDVKSRPSKASTFPPL